MGKSLVVFALSLSMSTLLSREIELSGLIWNTEYWSNILQQIERIALFTVKTIHGVPKKRIYLLKSSLIINIIMHAESTGA
jgi:hypothetical protein